MGLRDRASFSLRSSIKGVGGDFLDAEIEDAESARGLRVGVTRREAAPASEKNRARTPRRAGRAELGVRSLRFCGVAAPAV